MTESELRFLLKHIYDIGKVYARTDTNGLTKAEVDQEYQNRAEFILRRLGLIAPNASTALSPDSDDPAQS